MMEPTQALPLSEQRIVLEAVPAGLARVFDANDIQTWADVEPRFTEAMLLVYPGVGIEQVRWLRHELARRRMAVRYTSAGQVTMPPAPRPPLAARAPDRAGVYFIQCGPFVKIGMALSVRKRFQGLQQVIPFQLELLGVIEPGVGQSLRDLERSFHQRFQSCHQCAEWFRLEDALDVFCLALARGEASA